MKSRYSLAASVCLAALAASACGRESKEASPSPGANERPPPPKQDGMAKESSEKIADQKATAQVMCFGINACKGHNGCAVTAEDIAATQKDFGDKFARSSVHTCATLGSCNASSGELNWESKERTDCFAGGGFLIESVDGARVVLRS